ncbi:MAG: hypothetical protein R3Y38_01850 [Rikenellaceae bacterium]
MPLIKTIQLRGAQLSIWHITESVNELESGLIGGELAVCKGFKSDSRKREFAASRVMLHCLLSGHEVEYANSGAPKFKDLNKGLSISHSGDYAICLVSDKQSCAVDVEFLARDISRLKHKFLLQKEQEILGQEKNYIIAWCAKEAAYKFLQRENVDFKEHLMVSQLDVNAKTIKILAFSEQILPINYLFFQDLVVAYII